MATDTVELQNESGSKVTVHLHGATVISWIDRGEEIFFCSKQAIFDNKTPIRAGIPLVFPHIGPWSLGPKHGFARRKRWTLESEPHRTNDGSVTASFSLVDDQDTRAIWDARFKLMYTVCLGKDRLNLTLDVCNTDTKSFSFTTLMHTYFHVADINKTRVFGLQGLKYKDIIRGGKHTDDEAVIFFGGEELDKLYEKCPGPVKLVPDISDECSNVTISTSGFPDIIVWNPGAETAKRIPDLGDEEYKTMVCVEAAARCTPLTLDPGANLTFTETIVVSQAKNKL